MTTASQLFADIETGCMTEVTAARSSYYDHSLGLTVHQSFWVYPNGAIVALNRFDGSNRVIDLCGDAAATFEALYMPQDAAA